MSLELDPDRRLALAYVPAPMRPSVNALWRLDVTLASILATGRDPSIKMIKLAWWREALERLDREAPPPEPLLHAIAEHLLPAGISGTMLAEMEAGWAALVEEPKLGPQTRAEYAAARGGPLFRHSAFLLGHPEARVERAGEGWALVDLARHSSNPLEGEAALAAAGSLLEAWRWPAPLRPLGMLAALARRDAERGSGQWENQGSPARMARMMWHSFSGR
jgi:phytoene synthase